MTNPNYTHFALLVDRSGSMESMRTDAQGGINTVIRDQAELSRSQPDLVSTVTIYDFDNEYRKVFGPVDVTTAPTYTLEPRNTTALNDALMRAIRETGDWLSSLSESERPSQVKFIIVTDGHENASTEFVGEAGQRAIKEKIDKQTNTYSWEFVYIGANVDAYTVGQSYGIRSTVSYTPSAASNKAMYKGVSDGLSNSRVASASLGGQRVNTAQWMASSYGDDGTASGTATSTDTDSWKAQLSDSPSDNNAGEDNQGDETL